MAFDPDDLPPEPHGPSFLNGTRTVNQSPPRVPFKQESPGMRSGAGFSQAECLKTHGLAGIVQAGRISAGSVQAGKDDTGLGRVRAEDSGSAQGLAGARLPGIEADYYRRTDSHPA